MRKTGLTADAIPIPIPFKNLPTRIQSYDNFRVWNVKSWNVKSWKTKISKSKTKPVAIFRVLWIYYSLKEDFCGQIVSLAMKVGIRLQHQCSIILELKTMLKNGWKTKYNDLYTCCEIHFQYGFVLRKHRLQVRHEWIHNAKPISMLEGGTLNVF